MRCNNCETEPLKPAHFCECCGHALEARVEETSQLPLPTKGPAASDTRTPPVEPEAADDWAPNPTAGPRRLRCPSCDGPSLDGNQCPACYELARAESAKPPTEESCDDAAIDAIESTVKNDAAARRQSVRDTMTAEEKLASARATAAETVRRVQEKAQRPAAATPRPIPVAPKKPRYHPIELAAASLVVAALGAGAVWDRIHLNSSFVRHEAATTVAPAAAPTQVAETVSRPSAPIERPVAQTPVKSGPAAPVDRTPVVAKVPPARPSTPVKVAQDPAPVVKPAAKTPPPSQPKVAVPPPRPARKPAAVVVNKPAPAPAPAPAEKPAAPVLVSAPVVAAPAVVVAEPAPKPAAAAAPVGPFFELNQVNEAPRITGRASPKLPAALRDRSINEVVVVRALVSQSGQASRVSLLRRSKAGPEIDDAVLEVVNQWTFSPARKKGEPVSCWFNFAVPVGRDE